MSESPSGGVALKILVSAGESSGELYGARVVEALQRLRPDLEFFGCAGPHMRQAGVRPVVRSESLSVVGLVEVVSHIPRIYGEFRKICRAAARERPALALLVDSPDFHLRLAAKLKRQGIPVVHLVAPQAWAWRRGRVKQLRRDLVRLLCIFPFEEAFFRRYGVQAEYIGHPMAAIVHPKLSREEFFRKHGLDPARPVVVALPGSRRGEIARHLPPLRGAVERLSRRGKTSFILGAPLGFSASNPSFFPERMGASPIKVVEGESWDAIAHADLVLAASGTVTIEAALLGTPMVTFYRVTPLSWWIGRPLVHVPFYTMVNLVAGRKIVPELIQDDMTGENIAAEAGRLLDDADARETMRRDLAGVAAQLSAGADAIERAASIINETLARD